jgi:hypothetical protein
LLSFADYLIYERLSQASVLKTYHSNLLVHKILALIDLLKFLSSALQLQLLTQNLFSV